MTHNSANYQQNYQNYYQNTSEQYEDYYEHENQDLKGNFDERPPDLQVPNARLYAEGYPDVTELYARNVPFAESQQPVEKNMEYRHEYNPRLPDYPYNVSQSHSQLPHRTRVPKPQQLALQNYRYSHHSSLYPHCPLATSHSLQGAASLNPDESNYLSKVGVNSLQGIGRSTIPPIGMKTYQEIEENNYKMEGYNEHQQKYDDFEPREVYQTHENYDDYSSSLRQGFNMGEYGTNQEIYVPYKEKRYGLYGNKMGRSSTLRKYPVTVKTPKYVSKNQILPPVNKRPCTLSLPVVTQPDPGLVRRRSRTNHLKRTYDQSEPLPQNPNYPTDNYECSAHQMDSEGDMNPKSLNKGVENLLDQFENKVMLSENQETGDGEGDRSGVNDIKEFSKFLKPRIPPSVRAKQEKIAKMKSTLLSSVALQPKMKLSLDKLLNRLQNCEESESGERLSEKSYKSTKENKEKKSKDKEDNKHGSFNYESLSRKLTPRQDDQDEKDKPTSLLEKPSTSLTTSLDNKKSSRFIKPLDDNCALDLHRSKSYIVDLIDRALSKELGTVPRGKSIQHDMTPKRAVTTISRHQTCNKELCYEVTAALTDSFISNATANQKQDSNQPSKESESDDKLCKCFSGDASYVKQLKQLRWGHIRHIQQEARKLADLEEFLEKCGEIEF